jgi:hypothetical protein
MLTHSRNSAEDAIYQRNKTNEQWWADVIADQRGRSPWVHENLLKYRDAGLDYQQLYYDGGIEVAEGYTYNPITQQFSGQGFRSGMGGYDPNHDPRGSAGWTKLGDDDFAYTGRYDPRVLGMLTEDDWAYAQGQASYDDAASQYERYIQSRYEAEQAKLGMGATSVHWDSFAKKYDIDAGFRKVFDDIKNKQLKAAYEQALGRWDVDQYGEYRDVHQMYDMEDWTDIYQERYRERTQDESIQLILNNPNLTDEQRYHHLKQFGEENLPEHLKQYAPAPKAPTLYPDPMGSGKFGTFDMATGRFIPQESPQQSPAWTPSDSYSQDNANKFITDPSNVFGPPTASQQPIPTEETFQAPWSSDFEKQFLETLQGFGTSLSSYLQNYQQPKQSSPVFSLAGDTGQYNSGMVSSTPTSVFGSSAPQSSSPSASKTGQTTTWS